jgi:hypothetical protein
MHEWIKLHTALRDSEVYADPNAKAVFLHLLLIADSNGKGRVSRFKTSIELGMKPSTFVGALKRCHQRYGLADIKTNNSYTTFSLKNWSKYQSIGDTSTDIKPTSNRHVTDTKPTLYKEEIKNKSKNILDKSNGETPIKEKIVKPQEDKRNNLVNHVLAEFEKVVGYKPTDQKPRWVAQNLITRLRTITRDRLGGEITDERIQRAITAFFGWLRDQDWIEHVQKLETCKNKLPMFEATLPERKHATDSKTETGTSGQTSDKTRGVENGEILRGDRSGDAQQNKVLRGSVRETTQARTGGDFQGMDRILPERASRNRLSETEFVRSGLVVDERGSQSLSSTKSGIEQATRVSKRGVVIHK